jgi:hypothetical protein
MVGEGMKQKTNGVGGERATGHLRPFDRVPGKPSLPRWTRASLRSSPLPTLQNMSRPMLTSLRDWGTTDEAAGRHTRGKAQAGFGSTAAKAHVK